MVRPLLKRRPDGQLYKVPGSLPRTPRSIDYEHDAQPVSDETGAQQPTSSRAGRRGRAKLPDDDVRAIRADYVAGKRTQSDLAYIYGVTQSAIGSIVRGDSCKDVKPEPTEQD
jgi:hypothetical protein